MNCKKTFLPALFASLVLSGFSRSAFYDSIKNINLTITQSNWDYQPDTAKNGRVAYLSTTPEFQQMSPTIDIPVHSPILPQYLDSIHVTSVVTDATSVTLGYRFRTPDIFQHIPMYDDGNHHDGGPGDGTYGATIAANSAQVEYYIYAENNDAAIFSPVRSEYEFHTIEVGVNQLSPGAVTINEFMADNTNGANDQDGQYDDWIELYNTTGETVSLFGLYLSDDDANKTKWAFPQDATIPAFEYAIVWADEDGMQTGWHANFKLSKNGEMLLLGYGEDNVLEQYTFGLQQSDISEGRCANGVGDFVTQSPSYSAANNCNVATNEIKDFREIILYPNPAENELVISAEAGVTKVEVFDRAGNILLETNCNLQHLGMDVSSLVPGLYLVRVNGEIVKKLTVVH